MTTSNIFNHTKIIVEKYYTLFKLINSKKITHNILLGMDNKKCYTFAGGPTMAPDFLKQALD